MLVHNSCLLLRTRRHLYGGTWRMKPFDASCFILKSAGTILSLAGGRMSNLWRMHVMNINTRERAKTSPGQERGPIPKETILKKRKENSILADCIWFSEWEYSMNSCRLKKRSAGLKQYEGTFEATLMKSVHICHHNFLLKYLKLSPMTSAQINLYCTGELKLKVAIFHTCSLQVFDIKLCF